MSTLEVNSLIHLDASSNNLDLDSSGNATVNGNMTATQFYGGGGNLTGVGVDGIVSTANATAITIDSNENVGIGVTPSSWTANNYRALQVGGLGALSAWTSAGAGSDVILSCNTYHQAGLKYMITEEASRYHQVNGTHTFYTAESGTADSAISWTTALTITKEGKVGIGDSSPAANFNISNGTTGVRSLEVESSGSNNESVGVFKTSNSGFNDTILMAQNLNGTGGSLLKLQAGGSTVLEVKATGGILFNGDTAAANALDDYEEGEILNALEIGGVTQTTYSSGRGGLRYTKIGNICHCWGYIDTQGATLVATGYVKIRLPFAVAPNSESSNVFTTGMQFMYCYTGSSPYKYGWMYLGDGNSTVELTETSGSSIQMTSTSDRFFGPFGFTYRTG